MTLVENEKHEFVEFQSTSSMRRMTIQPGKSCTSTPNFNPHPPCGGWRRYRLTPTSEIDFNPHPPCGGWLTGVGFLERSHWISIHILHAEDDRGQKFRMGDLRNFNPHPPCRGWRMLWIEIVKLLVFQSTSSMQRMTSPVQPAAGRVKDFNPHPPCRGWHNSQRIRISP